MFLIPFCQFTYFYLVLKLRGISWLFHFYNFVLLLFGFVNFIVIFNLIALKFYLLFRLLICDLIYIYIYTHTHTRALCAFSTFTGKIFL
jgi:hypothetical protein